MMPPFRARYYECYICIHSHYTNNLGEQCEGQLLDPTTWKCHQIQHEKYVAQQQQNTTTELQSVVVEANIQAAYSTSTESLPVRRQDEILVTAVEVCRLHLTLLPVLKLSVYSFSKPPIHVMVLQMPIIYSKGPALALLVPARPPCLFLKTATKQMCVTHVYQTWQFLIVFREPPAHSLYCLKSILSLTYALNASISWI